MMGGDHKRPVIGEMLAHYRVLEKLARGGMGEIYLAEDTRLSRRVALKVLTGFAGMADVGGVRPRPARHGPRPRRKPARPGSRDSPPTCP